MKQYNAIWPLPGGVENYFEALRKILRHIQENEPLREKMVEDYRGLFPGTDKEHVIGTQMLIPVHLGFAEFSVGKFRITKEGVAFLQKPDVFGLYRKLAEAHLRGAGERPGSVTQLALGPSDQHDREVEG
jgi:hypothetical protein